MEIKPFNAKGFSPSETPRSAGAPASGATDLGDGLRELAKGMAARQDEDDYHSGVLAFAKGLNGLDAEFEEDQDLATLSQRRAERVRDLSERTLEGKSNRVQKRLRERFDLAGETDAAKWKAVVTKRDSANRVAQFNEDADEYLNHMIQAKTDDDFQKAKALWEGRLEAIRPFMSVGEFSRIREGAADRVKFRRAWNATTGEGAFDPQPYMDLSPEQVSQLEARHYAVARERARAVAEHQSYRMQALAPRLEDSLASAMTEGVPMDGTEDMLAELSGLGERGAAAAAQYRAQFSGAATVWNVLDAVKDQPFAAQMAAVQAMRPEPGSEGYRIGMETYQRAAGIVTQKAKAFQADPAGFVRGDAERRARTAGDSWMTDEDLEPLIIEASLDRQRELGNPDPKVLTVAQAKGIKDQFERSDGDGKAALLQQLEGYGEYSRRALREAGLGLGQTFLAEMYLDDPVLGRKALDIASVKESDIAVDPARAKDIRKDVSEAYYAGPGNLFGQLYNVTGDPKWNDLNKELFEVTKKMALASGNPAEAMDAAWNKRFNVAVDEDMMIHTPKDVDADDVAGRLRAVRAALPPQMQAFRHGIWKNSEDGDGFVLVLPHGGRAMTVDGTLNTPIRVVTYDELSGIAALPASAAADTVYGAALDMGRTVQ
ncbi:hypothetical protein ACR42D_09960 [Desulfovibrio caledoniensis]